MKGNLSLSDGFRHQKPFRPGYTHTRNYATGPVKPRPYKDKTQAKPLVGVRPPGSATPNAKPSGDSKAKTGVVAPYWRISLGVILCGSMIYSMVLPTIYH